MLSLSLLPGAANLSFGAEGDTAVPAQVKVEVKGDWQFKPDKENIGLKEGWDKPGLDDSSWKAIKVPMSWEKQGYDYDGVAWYRHKFTVPADWRGKEIVIMLPCADDTDDTFINGTRIGGLNKAPLVRRAYKIPGNIINLVGENLIAIRVEDHTGSGGLTEGRAELVVQNPPRSAMKKGNQDESVPEMELSCNESRNIGRWKSHGHVGNSRIKTSFQENAFNGKNVLVAEIGFPQASSERLTCPLEKNENGDVWDVHGYGYISFWYNAEETQGDVFIDLPRGNSTYRGRVAILPGKWRKAVLPFSMFYLAGYHPRPPYPRLENLRGIGELNITTLSNSLRTPGKISFSDFKVGSFRMSKAFSRIDFSPVSLGDFWNCCPDKNNEGEKNGWFKADFNDSSWSSIIAGGKWKTQGIEPADRTWIRRNIFIPAEWQGMPLEFTCRNPVRGALWFNGEKCPQQSVNKSFFITVKNIRYGALNQISLCLENSRTTILEVPEIVPGILSVVLKTEGEPEPPQTFDFGIRPPSSMEISFQFPGNMIELPDGLKLKYDLIDYNFRRLQTGEVPVVKNQDGMLVGTIRLDKEGTRQLYYSEFFEYLAVLKDADGNVVFTGGGRISNISYASRDAKELAPLQEAFEETPYGRLRLVDRIDCAADPEKDDHPYKEGGINWGRWLGSLYYYNWIKGIDVEEILGRKCRTAGNSEWFGYRIGRGQLKPGSLYLLRVVYPEDKPRYVPMQIETGWNFSCPGWKNGVSPEDPFDNYPLSGKYENYDNIVALDDTTYGQWGFYGDNPSGRGFWVFFMDTNGAFRGYPKSQFKGGPAVAEIKLYEIGNPKEHYPRINFPEGLPQRILAADWEREPRIDPEGVSEMSRFMGLNMISPVILKWQFMAYWDTKLGYNNMEPFGWAAVARDGKEHLVYQRFLEATAKAGIKMAPRIEYGGSSLLPDEAKVIDPNGKIAKPVRFSDWGADILHPATWEEVSQLIDELVGRYYKEYPQLCGIFFRSRCGRLQMGFSKFDVELFCSETGEKFPAAVKTPAEIAKWASSKNIFPKYEEWWQRKKADFLTKIEKKLQSYRPDMKLFYYNWDGDNWTMNIRGPTNSDEWAMLYDNSRKNVIYEKELEHFRKFSSADLLDKLKNMSPAHNKARPDLLKNISGINYLAPVSLRYCADNPEYLKYFETGSGLAVSHMVLYEEVIAKFCQYSKFEGSMLTPAGPAFSMAFELWAWFYGDANVLTFTSYTYGRGFADAHRRFAQAYLALPAIKGTDVDIGNPDIKVRTYDTKNGIYLGVGHKGYKSTELAITIPGTWKGSETVTDLVTGNKVDMEIKVGKISFRIEAGPIELNSYIIK